MSDELRRIIKIFLASPGDLAAERETAKRVVDELNEMHAEFWGHQLQLVGWEATLPSFGRPQTIINNDLDQCEFVIGLLWKRWGTPTSTTSGYTSGFEEEFMRSMDRRRSTAIPEITMLFKNIDQDDLRDPGQQLKKVLKFRNELSAKKEILYSTFSAADFEKTFRSVVVGYVQKILKTNASLPNPQLQQETVQKNLEKANSEGRNGGSYLLSENTTTFISTLFDKPDDWNALEPIEVARIRLIGASLSRNGNDEFPMGPHDLNLIYRERQRQDLSDREIVTLARSGLNGLNNQNVPVWTWLQRAIEFDPQFAEFTLVSGTSALRTAVWKIANLLKREIKSFSVTFTRDELVKLALRPFKETAEREAAVNYLGSNGTLTDVSLIAESVGNEDPVSQLATQAVISILARFDRAAAIEKLVEVQPEALSQRLVANIFDQPASISTQTLNELATHRNASIRRLSVEILSSRSALKADTAMKLIQDPDAETRLRALKQLQLVGLVYSDSDARALLVVPKASLGLGLFGRQIPDQEGLKAYNEFLSNKCAGLNEGDLVALLLNSSDEELTYSMALLKKLPKKYDAAVRQYLTNSYGTTLKSLILGLNGLSVQHPVEGARETVDEARKIEVRTRILEFICSQKTKTDINFVRHVVDAQELDFSFPILKYLSTYGTWEDIGRILKFSSGQRSTTILGYHLLDDNKADAISNYILHLAKGREIDLFKIELDVKICWRVVRNITKKSFKALGRDTILSGLRSKSDLIRLVYALKVLASCSKAEISTILSLYIGGEDQIYYNAVHWLDAGTSLEKKQLDSLVLTALENPEKIYS